MDKQTGPKGFLVVLPGEIIEIPQDSDKSWLTLFYSLPRELAEKWKPAYELPRCPYESCGRTNITTSYVTICSSCLCGMLRMVCMAILSSERPQRQLPRHSR